MFFFTAMVFLGLSVITKLISEEKKLLIELSFRENRFSEMFLSLTEYMRFAVDVFDQQR